MTLAIIIVVFEYSYFSLYTVTVYNVFECNVLFVFLLYNFDVDVFSKNDLLLSYLDITIYRIRNEYKTF